MKSNKKGFTLVEIMIVVAIIALLAAIAIPNVLRAKIAANDSFAVDTIKTISAAAEGYAKNNSGSYPSTVSELLNAQPPYLTEDYCDKNLVGYNYICYFEEKGYVITASPDTEGTTGTTTYTITTGGVMTP